MVWKLGTLGMDDAYYERTRRAEQPTYQSPRLVEDTPPVPKLRQQGMVIAQIGLGGGVSRTRDQEWVENVYSVDHQLLGYNAGKMILLYCPDNDRAFDMYIGLPFTKGMTERETGRTMLIAGSNAHHGEVMERQFDDVLWRPMDKDRLSYGNLIRWVNVGDTKTGFIGLDYNPKAAKDDGVASGMDDITFLVERLIEYGFDPKKRLFLLQPPHIKESEAGWKFRREGKATLVDYLTC